MILNARIRKYKKRVFADVNGNCFRPIDCTLTRGFDMSFLKAVDRFIPTEMEDDQDNKCQNTHSVVSPCPANMPGMPSTLILPRASASRASDVINMVKSSVFTVKNMWLFCLECVILQTSSELICR